LHFKILKNKNTVDMRDLSYDQLYPIGYYEMDKLQIIKKDFE